MITSILIILGNLLPDFHPHRKIIKRWLKIFNIKIKYLSRFTDSFSADIIDNKLFISRFNKAIHSREEYLYSIAHELGHLLDFAHKEHFHLNTKNSLTKKDLILKEEEDAWKLAEMLLVETEDFNKEKYILFRDKCLQQYEKALNAKRSKKSNKTNSRSHSSSKKIIKKK